MKIKFKNGEAIVTPTPKERFATDSAVWYAIRNELIAKGHDVIKKLMHKDGHMVDQFEHYVRTRRHGKGPDPKSFMLDYSSRGLYYRTLCKALNDAAREGGSVVLFVHRDIWTIDKGWQMRTRRRGNE
jgi:hypothetical protein